jgi:prepilin-type N-terminal cleavage/methylation domain-containing protein
MNISKNKGFTLIELLVCVAIIAILTAIVTSNFSQARAKSRDAKRISDIAQLQLALEGFVDRCSAYPASLATTANNGCPGSETLGTFISQIPTSPSPGSYAYYVKNDGSDYMLKTTLETSSSVLNDTYTSSTSGFTPSVTACSITAKEYCVVPR